MFGGRKTTRLACLPVHAAPALFVSLALSLLLALSIFFSSALILPLPRAPLSFSCHFHPRTRPNPFPLRALRPRLVAICPPWVRCVSGGKGGLVGGGRQVMWDEVWGGFGGRKLWLRVVEGARGRGCQPEGNREAGRCARVSEGGRRDTRPACHSPLHAALKNKRCFLNTTIPFSRQKKTRLPHVYTRLSLLP